MGRLKIIPLIFLVLGATMGLIMRFHLDAPYSWLKFTYWLHAHSHVLVLGWISNALLLVYTKLFATLERKFRVAFITIQFVLVGMTVAFALHGYSVYSIVLSAVHLAITIVYLGWIYQSVRTKNDLPHRVLKISFLFYVLSALGPLMLGPLSVLGLGQTAWKSYAVHFYLHFLLNGAFLFGTLAIFLKLLTLRSVSFNEKRTSIAISVFFWSTFPSFFLGILSDEIPRFVTVMAFVGAVGEIVGFMLLIAGTGRASLSVFAKPARLLFIVAYGAFALKCLLQLSVIVPDVAIAALNSRPLVIAYLHLVLIGFITSFLFGWYVETSFSATMLKAAISLFFIAFVGLELGLTLQALVARAPPFDPHILVIGSSAILWLSFVMFFMITIKYSIRPTERTLKASVDWS